ncbi:hypothetical protein CFII64_28904 [Pseudomonas sp. CFII64]|nr:hypothetical protein [Pseudomonas sp. CFII64]EPJ75918.1 hypothetical protein CFII64_28904 [Pseudomonas sp. CFII64]
MLLYQFRKGASAWRLIINLSKTVADSLGRIEALDEQRPGI